MSQQRPGFCVLLALMFKLVPTVSLFYSLYGIELSRKSSTKLKTYEGQAEQAAEWSDAAEERLKKTRSTQGSAMVSIALSMVTTLVLIADLFQDMDTVRMTSAVLNFSILVGAYYHINNFWKSKAKVPLLKDYNEAISHTQEIMRVMWNLCAQWVVLGLWQAAANWHGGCKSQKR